jgi:hypothetical protein
MNTLFTLAYTASAPISPCRIVALDAAAGGRSVRLASGVADAAIGLSGAIGANKGNTVDVLRLGVGIVECGGDIEAGSLVASGADGLAVAAIGGLGKSIGIAEESGSAGDKIAVFILPQATSGGGSGGVDGDALLNALAGLISAHNTAESAHPNISNALEATIAKLGLVEGEVAAVQAAVGQLEGRLQELESAPPSGGGEQKTQMPDYANGGWVLVDTTSTGGEFIVEEDCYAQFIYDMEGRDTWTTMNIIINSDPSHPVYIWQKGNSTMNYEKQTTGLFLFQAGTVIRYGSSNNQSLIQNFGYNKYPIKFV